MKELGWSCGRDQSCERREEYLYSLVSKLKIYAYEKMTEGQNIRYRIAHNRNVLYTTKNEKLFYSKLIITMSANKSIQIIDKEELKKKSQHPNSTIPHPFLKWAGSKRYLLRYIVEFLPDKINTYHEPFLGAGSLFFLLTPSRAYLGDKCAELINTYIALKNNPQLVAQYLSEMKPSRSEYYKIRDNPSSKRYQHAAEFVYLNKMCWNGLYRVNSSGKFNVPYGIPNPHTKYDVSNLEHCSSALNKPNIIIECADFSKVLERAEKNDLVYLDPPYVIGHSNNGFRDYNEVLFSWEDQIRLAETAHNLVKRGVNVIVTNACHPAIHSLYSGFDIRNIERMSTLASDITKRTAVKESVIVSKSSFK